MSDPLNEAATETLQQRLVEELEAQQRLQDELKTALESERGLRLENDLLWAYLQRQYPKRVKDAQELLQRLAEGSDLSIELRETKQPSALPEQSTAEQSTAPSNRTVKKRVRGMLGKVPGVHRVYHGLKNLGK